MSLTIVNDTPKPEFTITDSAWRKLCDSLMATEVVTDEDRANPTFSDKPGLRIAVMGGGCSGFSYNIYPERITEETDKVLDIHGLKVYIDEVTWPYIKGLEIDYVQEGLQSSFKFNNPNATKTCGCGTSFSVDD